MRILLSNRSHEIQVDDCDYALRKIGPSYKRKDVYMAREVFSASLDRPLKPWPEEIVDHWDRNTLNNQIGNPRSATCTQNTHNSGRRKNNKTSIYKGVTKYNRPELARPWRSQLRNGGGVIVSHFFDNELDAALDYDKMAFELNGEFAHLNFPQAPQKVEVAA